MFKALGLIAAITLACSAAPCSQVTAAPVLTAVVTPYDPEWKAFLPLLQNASPENVGGTHFVSGVVEGQPVLLVESGIGPVNATMASQIAIDHFGAKRLVVVGIAGGVDPRLHIGDVTIPARWSEYLYSVFARATPDGFRLPGFAPNTKNHFGMIFPQPVPIGHAPGAPIEQEWLEVDPQLMHIARAVADETKLDRCLSDGRCLSTVPTIDAGGSGVSGPAFVDNADFRRYVEATFHATALDMESAAVAHVAASNGIAFIAIRSLSDLARGGAASNEMKTFEESAAHNAVKVFAAFMAHIGKDAP